MPSEDYGSFYHQKKPKSQVVNDKTSIKSQFVYCPLIWIFCSKTDIQRVEKGQYKTLQVQVVHNYMTTYGTKYSRVD